MTWYPEYENPGWLKKISQWATEPEYQTIELQKRNKPNTWFDCGGRVWPGALQPLHTSQMASVGIAVIIKSDLSVLHGLGGGGRVRRIYACLSRHTVCAGGGRLRHRCTSRKKFAAILFCRYLHLENFYPECDTNYISPQHKQPKHWVGAKRQTMGLKWYTFPLFEATVYIRISFENTANKNHQRRRCHAKWNILCKRICKKPQLTSFCRIHGVGKSQYYFEKCIHSPVYLPTCFLSFYIETNIEIQEKNSSHFVFHIAMFDISEYVPFSKKRKLKKNNYSDHQKKCENSCQGASLQRSICLGFWSGVRQKSSPFISIIE